MANPELIIFGAALAPLAVAMASLVAARVWRQTERHRFELESRTGLVRALGFQSIGRRTLSAHLFGRQAVVSFGLADETGWHRVSKPARQVALVRWKADPDEVGAPNRRPTATIEVVCAANLPEELLVEMLPPVVLRGRRDRAFALLEIPFRGALGEGERAQWHDGRLRLSTCRRRAPSKLIELVERAVKVAADLERDGIVDVERRLVDEALFTRSVEARLRAIRLLVEFHSSPLTKSALFRLTADDDEVVQLTAARALGPEGEPKLRALAESSRTPATIRMAAIHALADRASTGASMLLTRLLSDADPAVATVALRRLASLAKHDAFEPVRNLILRPGMHEDVVLAGIDYMERIGFPKVADVMHQLSSHRSERVQSAAIDVIGRHGDLTWLPPLRQRLEHYSLPLSLSVSVESAIALIRSRHRAGAGRLSLSPESSGLALGALSPPKTPGLAIARDLNQSD